LTPDNICFHLSAVRHHFRSNCQDLAPFENPTLRACKTALKLRHLAKAELSNPRPSKKRLPLSADMLIHMAGTHDIRSLQGAMIITAAYMGFCMLLRGSEYLYEEAAVREKRSHAFLAKDVEFLLDDGTLHLSTNAANFRWEQVTLVKLTLRHAKNDKFRIGKTTWFRAGQHKIGPHDLVELLFNWASRANLRADAMFLSYKQTGSSSSPYVPLRMHQMREAVKKCAAQFRLPTDLYGCHSLRVGGTCALRAGGASDSMIQLLGRWQTMPSSLGYQDNSTEEFDRMLGIMSDTSRFTVDDIRIKHMSAGLQLPTSTTYSAPKPGGPILPSTK